MTEHAEYAARHQSDRSRRGQGRSRSTFPVNDLFDRLRSELTFTRSPQGLSLRVVPCGLSIRSDPRLLEQMIRNLLSNALKYTQRGRVLLGCRRRAGTVAHRNLGYRPGHPDVRTRGDFRGISSGRQSGARAQPRPRPGAFDRQEPLRLARASDPRALAAWQGIGIFNRGPAGTRLARRRRSCPISPTPRGPRPRR